MTGNTQLLDLIDPRFWAVVLGAVLMLAPVTSTGLRTWVWAGVNVIAIAVLLSPATLAGGVCLTVSVWAAAQTIQRTPMKTLVFAAALALLLGVFVLHKINVAADFALSPVKPVLVGLGFAYASLRSVELLRAIRDEAHAAPSPISTFNYLLPFHMLSAGPIQAYAEYVDQPIAPRLDRRSALEAAERITFGLFKKFVLAAVLSDIFLTDFRAQGAYAFLEIQFFYLWVYLDFSAYSDIAVGLGRLMGVRTPENFNRPLSARNITVFWERWHISLSLFIRRNIFTPVQLALVRRNVRVSPLVSASLAIAVAFLLCGLWHGVNLRFLAWGAMHALGLIICNAYRQILRSRIGGKGVRRYLENRPIRWLATALTFEFVACSLAYALYPGTFWWE